jgi:hypothetical protein
VPGGRLDDGVLKLVRVDAGGVHGAEQRQDLAAEGLLDLRQLAHPLGAEHGAQPVGFGIDAADASGLLE